MLNAYSKGSAARVGRFHSKRLELAPTHAKTDAPHSSRQVKPIHAKKMELTQLSSRHMTGEKLTPNPNPKG